MAVHVDKEGKKDALIQGLLGGTQRMTIVNESGLYALILSYYSLAFPGGTPINVNKKKKQPP